MCEIPDNRMHRSLFRCSIIYRSHFNAAIKESMSLAPGTPRPSKINLSRLEDRRFLNGKSLSLPSPSSPSLGFATPDVVYRSLFQQPSIEVEAAFPSLDWFDFLLNPSKLDQYVSSIVLLRCLIQSLVDFVFKRAPG